MIPQGYIISQGEQPSGGKYQSTLHTTLEMYKVHERQCERHSPPGNGFHRESQPTRNESCVKGDKYPPPGESREKIKPQGNLTRGHFFRKRGRSEWTLSQARLTLLALGCDLTSSQAWGLVIRETRVTAACASCVPSVTFITHQDALQQTTVLSIKFSSFTL